MDEEEMAALAKYLVKQVNEAQQATIEKEIGSIQLTGADLDLLQLCPIAALLGTATAFFITQKFPRGRKAWLLGGLRGGLLGAVAGLLVATFFLGMSTNGTWSTPRIVVLSFLMGANAAKVWESALELSMSFIGRGKALIGKAGGDAGAA